MKEFGTRLEQIMKMKGYTQKKLAEESGLTEAAISRYIAGQREPKAIAIVNIARVLNVTADDLLGIERIERDDVDDALQLVARNASEISKEKKMALINALIG